MNIRRLQIIQLLIFFLFLTACFSYKTSVRNSNVSYIYNPGSTPLHPEFRVYHNTDSTSVIYTEIFLNELLFIRKTDISPLEAVVKFKYELLGSIDENNILDSASYIFYIEK
ncbi:MAG: hypothetical protein ABIJ97_13555, partial [Bacteroidota bacterium]